MDINLKQLMDTVFERSGEPINDDAQINEISGWDSLAHVNLMVELLALGAPISPMDMAELTTYEKIKAFLLNAGMDLIES